MIDANRQQALVPIARPLYSQVRDILLQRINRGDWSTGDALPNEFQLASELGVSIGTLRRAIEGLEDAGVVIRRQGRGTYVSAIRWNGVSAKYNVLRLRNDQTPTLTFQNTKILRRPVAPREAVSLLCSSKSDVYEIEQVILVSSQIIGLEIILVHADSVPNLDKRLHKDPDIQSAYAEQGLAIARVTDHVGLAKADKAIATLLSIDVGAPLLALERVCFCADQRPLEITHARLLPDVIRYYGEISRQ